MLYLNLIYYFILIDSLYNSENKYWTCLEKIFYKFNCPYCAVLKKSQYFSQSVFNMFPIFFCRMIFLFMMTVLLLLIGKKIHIKISVQGNIQENTAHFYFTT